MNKITMTLQADHLILKVLKEDISSEDVSTNAVMRTAVQGEADLICKQDGFIAGLEVFCRVFELLDAGTVAELYCKDGDEVKNGQLLGHIRGDMRVLLSGKSRWKRKLLTWCVRRWKPAPISLCWIICLRKKWKRRSG